MPKPTPKIASPIPVAVHRALVAYARERLAGGRRGPAIARDVRAQGEQAIARIAAGLGDYAIKD